jgi:alpha-galactosidase
VDVAGSWHPGIGRIRTVGPDWAAGPQISRATTGAPVRCLFSQTDRNRLTFAVSDALHPIRLAAGIREETAAFVCTVELFVEPDARTDRYAVTLRLDTRDLFYATCLADVADWWAQQDGYAPATVPDAARRPIYSTWYSFHQRLDVDAVVEQCRLAKQMGCEAVIVDDGWQTTDSGRGYAFCGDWQPERIAEMAGFVEKVHQLDMKFLLWYSVPHVGRTSRAWDRFGGKILKTYGPGNTGILDPRYPDVRRYLIDTWTSAAVEWDLDGLKLDFVDQFATGPESPVGACDGRDIASVPVAADKLLAEAIESLRAVKPEICIEFRQGYIGPLMRTYGNMFRAGDCPADAMTNRVSTLDIRLLCGQTACHSDMILFHPSEPAPVAARQLLNVLFSVPQLSVRLDRIPDQTRQALAFWMDFWNQHRDVLLDGRLDPTGPASLYPFVVATGPHKRVAAVYADVVCRLLRPIPREVYVVNATGLSELAVELEENFGKCQMEAFDCRGRSVARDRADLPAGLFAFPVPPSGLLKICRR